MVSPRQVFPKTRPKGHRHLLPFGGQSIQRAHRQPATVSEARRRLSVRCPVLPGLVVRRNIPLSIFSFLSAGIDRSLRVGKQGLVASVFEKFSQTRKSPAGVPPPRGHVRQFLEIVRFTRCRYANHKRKLDLVQFAIPRRGSRCQN